MTTKTPATPPTVDEARAQLDDLRGQLSALEAKRESIGHRRPELAGAALIDKNTRASRRLTDLNAQSVSIGLEIENVLAAIKEGEARLKAAEAHEQRAADIARAHEIREILRQRGEHAGAAQAALAAWVVAMEALILSGRALRKLSDRATSDAHLSFAMEAATANCRFDFYRRGLLPSSPPPRSEFRVPLTEIIAHLDRPAARAADLAIGDEETQQEKAA